MNSNNFRMFLAALASSILCATAGAADSAPAAADKPKASTQMNKEELRKKLSPEQYHVACEGGTEPAFRNAYWNNHEPGLYVDVISGEPLFASVHKFDSGTGWPSFTQPVKKETVLEKTDTAHGMVRVEVRSAKSDAHLGHVFDDGPKPGGLRYCVNSASLRFIPVAKLKESGFEAWLYLFAPVKK